MTTDEEPKAEKKELSFEGKINLLKAYLKTSGKLQNPADAWLFR